MNDKQKKLIEDYAQKYKELEMTEYALSKVLKEFIEDLQELEPKPIQSKERKFKVGDRVKIVNIEHYVGHSGTIVEVRDTFIDVLYRVKGSGLFTSDKLELVKPQSKIEPLKKYVTENELYDKVNELSEALNKLNKQ